MNWNRISIDWLVMRLVCLAMQLIVIFAMAAYPLPTSVAVNGLAAAVHIVVIIAHHRHIAKVIDTEEQVSK